MQRLVMTSIFALGIATGASALVVSEDAAEADNTNTNYEETLGFVGNPVYTEDGTMIGVVSSATTDANGDRMILVSFDDSFNSDYAGWEFRLGEQWESTGELTVLWTAEELNSWIEANGAQQTLAREAAKIEQ